MSLFGRLATSAKAVASNLAKLNPVRTGLASNTNISSILSRFQSTVTYDTLEAIHLKGPIIKNR